MRFPRVTRIRDDKNWESATNLDELKHLYKTSKEKTDVTLLNKLAAVADDNYEPPEKKTKQSPKQIKKMATSPVKNGLLDKFIVKNTKSPTVNDAVSPKKEKNTPDKKRKDFSESSSSEKLDRKRKKLDYSSDTQSNASSFDDKKTDLPLPENPLPDVFKDKRLGFYPDFISIPEKLRNSFERHWIAYGGIIVKSMKSMDVDYVVHKNDVIDFKKMKKLRSKVPEGVRHVSKGWLIKCINRVELCDTRDFAVFVEP